MYEPEEMNEKSLEAIAISRRMEEIDLTSILREGNAVFFDWGEVDSIEVERARKRAFIEKDLSDQENELGITWKGVEPIKTEVEKDFDKVELTLPLLKKILNAIAGEEEEEEVFYGEEGVEQF